MTDDFPPAVDGPPAEIDTTVPHSARIWNYWLGGTENYPVDRAAGEEYRRVYPHIVDVARASRAFQARAVRFLAGEAGIGQFLDVGAGLPAAGNTHEIAQRAEPARGSSTWTTTRRWWRTPGASAACPRAAGWPCRTVSWPAPRPVRPSRAMTRPARSRTGCARPRRSPPSSTAWNWPGPGSSRSRAGGRARAGGREEAADPQGGGRETAEPAAGRRRIPDTAG